MKVNANGLKQYNNDIDFINKTKDNNQIINEQTFTQQSDVKEVIDTLDKDIIEPNTNMTSIDFNTRLTNLEIGGLVALQMLHSLDVGGNACSLISRSIKRHKVSLKGLGREEKVRMFQGDREHQENKDNSVFGKLKGFLNGAEK